MPSLEITQHYLLWSTIRHRSTDMSVVLCGLMQNRSNQIKPKRRIFGFAYFAICFEFHKWLYDREMKNSNIYIFEPK